MEAPLHTRNRCALSYRLRLNLPSNVAARPRSGYNPVCSDVYALI